MGERIEMFVDKEENVGSVFTNNSSVRSKSCSLDFCIFSSI